VEAVSIASASSSWLYEAADTDVERVSALIWADATPRLPQQRKWLAAHLVCLESHPDHAGSVVADFPQSSVYDGLGHVIGISKIAPDAGSDAGTTWSVVSYNVATEQLSTLATNPFQGVAPQFVVTPAIVPAH